VAGQFSDVTWDKKLVDAMTMRTTLKLRNLDTIVANNLCTNNLSTSPGAYR
jgi:tartrate dehydrogenase/decarboxylase/D-malate dehydrogenase